MEKSNIHRAGRLLHFLMSDIAMAGLPPWVSVCFHETKHLLRSLHVNKSSRTVSISFCHTPTNPCMLAHVRGMFFYFYMYFEGGPLWYRQQ